ncbi:MAG: glycosyltransferase family 2 protein, partial [Burkholderiales bacterium]
MEKVFIVLPVHNRREVTRKFVECLKRQTYAPYHLILVDDGSTDGTAEMVREGIPGATVIRGNGGWWWAGSLQQGLNWLKAAQPVTGDVVLFINDDVLFDRVYLRSALDVLRVNPGSMLLSRLRDPRSGEVRESGVHADLRRMNFTIASSAAEVNCLSTRGLFIKWGDVTKISNFHPSFLPHYWSDYEYTIRATR